MYILNMTGTPVTSDLEKHGVKDINNTMRVELKALLTFYRQPTEEELTDRCKKICFLYRRHNYQHDKEIEGILLDGPTWLTSSIGNVMRRLLFVKVYGVFFMPDQDGVQQVIGVTRVIT